jgi:polyhydroxyalkanoate synthesis repressor PhaR
MRVAYIQNHITIVQIISATTGCRIGEVLCIIVITFGACLRWDVSSLTGFAMEHRDLSGNGPARSARSPFAAQQRNVALPLLQVLTKLRRRGTRPMVSRSKDGDSVIIKKYANRRLYNTQTSSYITLEHLAKMTREGVDFKVLDAKTGDDITHQILTQIIMDAEAGGEQMLPVKFLRQLIGMYGNSMQSLVPHYLEASMENFRANQGKLAKVFEDSLGNNPLTKLAQQNMAIFRAAATAFMPGNAGMTEPAPSQDKNDDLAALREQMAAMQQKLDALGK